MIDEPQFTPTENVTTNLGAPLYGDRDKPTFRGHINYTNILFDNEFGRLSGRIGDILTGFDARTASTIADKASETRATLDREYINKDELAVSVLDYGAVGDGVTDDSAAFQRAIGKVNATGGVVLVPNTGKTYIFKASAAPTVTSPKRTLVTGDNVHIVGIGGPTIKMTGITKTYLDSIDDIVSSGRDVFTVFTFLRTSNSGVAGINFTGEWDGVGKHRFASPRCKAVGFIGVKSGYARSITGYGLFGNVVNVTPSNANPEGVYQPAYNVIIENCRAEKCFENGFNAMGDTNDVHFRNCVGIQCASTAVESASTRGTIDDCVSIKCKVAGFGIRGDRSRIYNSIVESPGSNGEFTDNGIGVTIAGSNNHVKNTIFTNVEGISVQVYPGASYAAITECDFIGGGSLAGTTALISCVGSAAQPITNLAFDNNRINQSANSVATYALNISNATDVSVSRNRIRMIDGTKTAVLVQTSATNVECGYNDVNAPITISVNAINCFKYNNVGNSKRIVEGTAPPTAGTWTVGDRVRNTITKAGAPIGWVCSVAGTPGTWNVEAVSETLTTVTGQLASASSATNTAGKYVGRPAFNTDTKKMVWATGSAPTDPWIDGVGSTAHTPA